MDIAAWLRELGLEQYTEPFRSHDIDADVLPSLTAEDLKELGVASIGHRRRMLDAIAALARPGAPPPLRAATTTLTTTTTTVTAVEAERRRLTVLFSDLVGSTALAAERDPEDMRAIIQAYQRCVAAVVERYEGYVAKYMGDGVLAYFGYPRAHEDDPERAVCAGLGIVEDVAALRPEPGLALRVRVGIATGPVVVGEAIGEGAARELVVVGEAPNIAARLQALAKPNTVVIGPATRRLVGDLFDLAERGAHRVKGMAEPLRAWRVLRPNRVQGRFEARERAGLTPLVGREHELELLLDRWRRAKGGEGGRVALVTGEPGIGKSRLVRTLRERLAGEPYAPLTFRCSPYHTNSVLYPVVNQLERAAGFGGEDSAAAKLDKLEALLAEGVEDVGAIAPLFADLLAIPTGGRYPPPELTPRRRKGMAFGALLDQLAALAAGRPVLAVVEDAHWIDPTSLELLGLAVERVRRLPVLLVVTARPGFAPPWAGDGHVTALALSRLSRRQAAGIVERLAGDRVLPAGVLEQIVARTDGVPLFVEELTKAVLESGLPPEQAGRHAPNGPPSVPAIPETLHDSLMARLDHLGPAKEVAQVAAVIGREFGHELLAAVAPLPEDALRSALDRLVEAGLVFRRGEPPRAGYSFKHVLVRDAAYGTLLRSTRRDLHRRIAGVLEERFPEVARARPEVLARHCAEAGLAEKAADYWRDAGRLALARSAMAEAVAALEQGLGALRAVPEGSGRDRRELDILTTLGAALIAAKGQAAPETGRAYARARELCRRLGDESEALFPVLYGQWVSFQTRAQYHAAQAAGAELLRLSGRRRDAGAEGARVVGHRVSATVSLALGELAAARAGLERALALYDPVRHGSLRFLYAQDPGVTAPAWLAWALLVLGHPDQARERHGAALDQARRLGHPNTLAQVLFCGAVFSQLIGDRPGVEEQVGALAPLAAEQGFPFWSALATVLGGWALADAGRVEAGIERMRRGLEDYRATGAEIWLPYLLALLAEAHGKAGEAARGADLLADALARAERTGERWFEPELHRRRGELLLIGAPGVGTAEAEACFRRALVVARGCGAKLWELRAAASLARLLHDRGCAGEARRLLAPVYDRFTEGFGTRDLKAAEGLLDEVG